MTKRRGMTLIEVVVGLVILGTLVASVAIARGRALRQYARADLQLRAARVADQMLSHWHEGAPAAIPLRGGGAVPELPGCAWRTMPLRDDSVSQFGAVKVRFEIIEHSASAPLISVEFVVPREVTS